MVYCFVLVICVCVFTHSRDVGAASYQVSANIHAPSSPYPAVITSPTSGTVSSATQSISGTCPVLSPQLIVTLWRDATFLGSTICNPDGTFSMSIQLQFGLNTITPKLKNITNDPGVDGAPIQLNYPELDNGNNQQPSITQQSKPNSSLKQLPISQSQPLQIESEKEFLLIAPDGSLVLTITIKDGEAPFVMLVDWGDGTSNTYRYNESGKKTVIHSYKNGSAHSITVRTTDKNGHVVTLVLGAVSSSNIKDIPIKPKSNLGTFQKYSPVVLATTAAIFTGGLLFVGLHHLGLIGNATINTGQTNLKKSKSGKSRVKNSSK